MTISLVKGLPDIVSVQKRLYPLIFTDIVSEQPTTQPIATAFGFTAIKDTDDSSGWESWKFKLARWSAEAKSSKKKTEISIEALQDMVSLGLSEDVVVESIADQIADDINKSIIDALKSISSVGSAVDVSTLDSKFFKGRELYSSIHLEIAKLEKTSGCQGSYVVVGGDAFGYISGSGLATRIGDTDVYLLESGVKMIHDKYATEEYFTVGVKKQLSDFEISSLVFSPYNFDGKVDGGIAYQYMAQDYASLNPVIGVISRYALTVAPLEEDQTGATTIDWDNLGALANSSKLSTTVSVTL